MQKSALLIILLCLLGKAAAGQNNTTNCINPSERNGGAIYSVSPHETGSVYIVDGIILAPGATDRCFPYYDIVPGSWFAGRSFGSPALSAEVLEAMPVFSLNDQLSTLAGFYQRRAGEDLNVTGARTDGNLYIVDGIRLR